jgi:hypothetical protein
MSYRTGREYINFANNIVLGHNTRSPFSLQALAYAALPAKQHQSTLVDTITHYWERYYSLRLMSVLGWSHATPDLKLPMIDMEETRNVHHIFSELAYEIQRHDDSLYLQCEMY